MLVENRLLGKIRQIQEEGKTGILKLGKEGKEISVYFRDGLIEGAGSDLPQLHLGKVLTRRGVLQNSLIPDLIKRARRKHMTVGRAAVSRKMLDEADLREGVHEQIVQALNYAIGNAFEVRVFKDSPVDLYQPARLDFDNLMLELVRVNIEPVQIDPYRMLSLNNGRNLSHLPWLPQELSVLSRLTTPCTLQDLAASTGLEYARLNRILSVFHSLKLINQVDITPNTSTALVKREGLPLEHLIPEISVSDLSEKMETFFNPSSFISEQFKTLKVQIAKASTQAQLRVIAVSSSSMEEGKSLISANLAVSFSQGLGRKVVIVDCDLRNPSLHKFLGASVEPGLLGYLESDYIQPHCFMRRLKKLYLITGGGISANPIELLSSARMKEMIACLKAEFDTIILDCPPFGPIADAQILTDLADGLIMVTRSGKTTYSDLDQAFQYLDKSKLIGMVFNDVKPLMFHTQYYYKYYNYRSSYPYSATKVPRRQKTYLE